jgi:hypothetical protein
MNVSRLENSELGAVCWEKLVLCFKFVSRNLVEGTEETTKPINQDTQYPGRESTPKTVNNEGDLLTTQLQDFQVAMI